MARRRCSFRWPVAPGSVLVEVFEHALQGKCVHDRGEHPHVIGGGASSMPRLLALAPRQKFPPPTTTAISSPVWWASRICRAKSSTISGEMLSWLRGSRRASPLSFRTATRLNRLPFHCRTHLERTKADLSHRCQTLFTPTEPLGAERPVGRRESARTSSRLRPSIWTSPNVSAPRAACHRQAIALRLEDFSGRSRSA